MDATQKLTIQAEVQGAQRSAQELQQVAAAQEQVNRAVTSGAAGAATGPVTIPVSGPRGFAPLSGGATTPPLDDATLKFKDLNNILSLIDPRLGAITGRLARASEAFGDLGTKAIDFAAVGKGLVETLTKMGPALGLLTAGGVAVGGIGFLISQFQRARREAEELRESMERIGKAQTDIGRTAMEDLDQIVAARDRRRNVESFDEEQIAAVRSTRAIITNNDEARAVAPLLVEFGGDSAFPGGGEFSINEMRDAVRQGFTIDESISPARNARRLRNLLRSTEFRRDRDRIHERLFGEAGLTRSSARDEATTTDPTVGTANLDTIIEEVAKQYGANPDEVRRAVMEQVKKEDDLRSRGVLNDVILNVRRAFISKQGPANGLAIDEVLRSLGGTFSTPSQAPVDRRPEQPTPEQPTPAAKTPGTPVSTTIHQYNGRYIGSDAAAQRGRMRNGETRARERELV